MDTQEVKDYIQEKLNFHSKCIADTKCTNRTEHMLIYNMYNGLLNQLYLLERRTNND